MKAKHFGHDVMSYNEKMVKAGWDPSPFNEGILWCETCQEEFVPELENRKEVMSSSGDSEVVTYKGEKYVRASLWTTLEEIMDEEIYCDSNGNPVNDVISKDEILVKSEKGYATFRKRRKGRDDVSFFDKFKDLSREVAIALTGVVLFLLFFSFNFLS